MRVGLRFDARADTVSAAAALRPIDLVTQVDRRPDLVIAGKKSEAALCAPDGRLLKSVGRIYDPAFAARIADALRIVARYKEMLALSNDQGAARADMTIDRNCDDVSPAGCASLHSVNGVRQFARATGSA